MKRSVNFNGMARYRKLGANDLIATFRFLGMSDAEIKARLLEMKASNNASTQTAGTLSSETEPVKSERPGDDRELS